MRSGINTDHIGYFGDLAPSFKRNEENNFIHPKSIAVCIGNGILLQGLEEEFSETPPSYDRYAELVAQVKEEYLRTLGVLKGINPDATIILVSPPYHGVAHKYIKNLLALERRINADVIKALGPDILNQVYIADMTSSMNPFDKSNYATVMDLNAVGVKKLERAVDYLLFNPTVKKGKVYSFHPDFLAKEDSPLLLGEDYIESSVQDWVIADPYDLKAGYTYKELALYEENHFKNCDFNTIKLLLLGKFKGVIDSLPAGSTLREPAMQVYERGDALFSFMENPEECKNWAISMTLALKVLNNPDNEIFVNMLRDNAMHRANQKTNLAQYFVAALVTLAGCAILAITAATMPLALTVSSVCLAVTGGLIAASGLTLFCRNPPLTNKDNFINLAEETRNQIVARRW